MTREEQIASLRKQNPYAPEVSFTIYLDALAEYQAAQKKIESMGTVMMSKGKPVENPYTKVRDRASKTLLACRLKTRALA